MKNELSKSSLVKKEKIIKQFFEGGENLTIELLVRYGFKQGHPHTYHKVIDDAESVLYISTINKEQFGYDYYEAYNGIKLYTLNDLKMLWYLLTREQLIEV